MTKVTMTKVSPKRVELKYRQEWCCDKYSIHDVQLEDPTDFPAMVYINGKSYKTKLKKITIPYHDNGIKYYATSHHIFIEECVFGVVMEFDLNEVISKTKVYVDYSTEEFLRKIKEAGNDTEAIKELCIKFIENN